MQPALQVRRQRAAAAWVLHFSQHALGAVLGQQVQLQRQTANRAERSSSAKRRNTAADGRAGPRWLQVKAASPAGMLLARRLML